jgi:hypothetical protein
MARWYISWEHNGVTKTAPILLNEQGLAVMGNFGTSIENAQCIPDDKLFGFKQDLNLANREAGYAKYNLYKLK